MKQTAAETIPLPGGIESQPQPITLDERLNEASDMIHAIGRWDEEEEELKKALDGDADVILHVGHLRIPVPKDLSPDAAINHRWKAHRKANDQANAVLARFTREMTEIRNTLKGDLE